MKRLLMVASALVVLALGDYAFAVGYSYYRPPLGTPGASLARWGDGCGLAVDLENEGSKNVRLISAAFEPAQVEVEVVRSLRGEMASSRPYVRPEEEVVAAPVAGAVIVPHPEWSELTYAIRTRLSGGEPVPDKLTVRYQYLGMPHTVVDERIFPGESCVADTP